LARLNRETSKAQHFMKKLLKKEKKRQGRLASTENQSTNRPWEQSCNDCWMRTRRRRFFSYGRNTGLILQAIGAGIAISFFHEHRYPAPSPA
jgi:hypothetical protein